MSEQQKRLEELFKAFSDDGTNPNYEKIRAAGQHFDAKELHPEPQKMPLYIPPELARAQMPELKLASLLKSLEDRMVDPASEESLRDRRLKFIKRYSTAYGPVPLPLTIRLVYDDFWSWHFQSRDRVNFVFDLMACSRRILEVFAIEDKPETIELQVWRPPFRHPADEGRIHPTERDPRSGSWISVMQLKVQDVTPFFSFEELELAHAEMWEQLREYARRSMNPCGELPHVEQNLGRFLPKQ